MKTQIIFLKVAAWICVLFVAFHLAFYHMFQWETSLSCLNQVNRSIFMTYHAICILILSFMAIVPLFQAKEILNTKMKYSILPLFAIFYIVRIISEFVWFGITASSPVILLLCAVPMILFSAPLLMKNTKS